jgi:hypothetical protein
MASRSMPTVKRETLKQEDGRHYRKNSPYEYLTWEELCYLSDTLDIIKDNICALVELQKASLDLFVSMCQSMIPEPVNEEDVQKEVAKKITQKNKIKVEE